MAIDEVRFVVAAKNSAAIKGRAERRVRLLRPRGLVDLGKVASGSATQGLWLGDRKVESQIIGENRSQLAGRGTIGEVRRRRRWGRRANDRTKEKIHRFRREKRAMLQVAKIAKSPAMPQPWHWR